MADPLYELFAFALDLYRAPLKYLSYVGIDRPIPRGFDALLEALNKREESEFWHDLSERFKASPEQFRNAGFFLVKRMLFAEGADHYRVLGLDSSADIGQARERYRLLMALFHPDRNQRGDEWAELYAQKINEAYNTLKNPDKKQVYDRSIRNRSVWGDDVPPPGSTGHGQAERPFSDDLANRETPLGEEDVARVPTKRPMLHIWIGLVLLGLIGWFIVQVYESGGLKIASRDAVRVDTEQESVVPVAGVDGGHRATLTPVAGKGGEVRGEGVSEEPQSGADRGESLQLVSPTARVATAPKTAADRKDDGIAQEPEIRDVGAQSGESAGSEQQLDSAAGTPRTPVVKGRSEAECPGGNCELRDASGPSENDRTPDDGVAIAQAVKKTPLAAKKYSRSGDRSRSSSERDATREPPESGNEPAQGDNRRKNKIIVGQRDIDFLVSRFIQAYEAGDIGKFVGLFSGRARTDGGSGRDLIAKKYGELFRTTRKRSMMIRDVMWTPKGDGVAKISFFAVIESEHPGSSDKEEYRGNVNLIVYMGLEGLKILKFVHQVERR